MSTIVTRSGKGSPLTNTEVDANFTGLNAEVGAALPKAGGAVTGAITTNSTFDGRDVAADGVTADAALPKAGGALTGAVTTTSTFDGRDVATDGTKLDTIETSATADQTGAQIKTAYEAETNAFTDAQFTKLGGIETSADVTDTTNVTAAGALMDSELAGIAAVKATTAAFLIADESKLDAIEASADVTDATNVTAAGALMDSELTAIASVKALNQGVATTDSPTFSTVNATTYTGLPATSETVSGTVELATQAEVDAGVDTTRAVTAATLTSFSGLGGGGTEATITQASHGLSVLDCVRYNGSSWVKAQADATTTTALGVVVEVVDVNNFVYSIAGRYTITHGLTVDEWYYLSAATAGGLTATAPTIEQPIVYTEDSTHFSVYAYRPSSDVAPTAASETASGVIELATQAEVDAGTDAVRAVTPATLTSFSGLGGGGSAKNLLINGDFSVWQRGTAAVTVNNTFYADRWLQQFSGPTFSTTQGTHTVGQTAVPNNPAFYISTVVGASAGSGDSGLLIHRVEDVASTAGETVTLSFYAKASSALDLSYEGAQNFGSGGSATLNSQNIQKFSLTTSWAKYTHTFTKPSISGKTVGAGSYLTNIFWLTAGSSFSARTDTLGNQAGTFDISNVQLEVGDAATDFEYVMPATQLARCQRYYWRNFPAASARRIANGLVGNSTTAFMLLPFPTELRSAATLSFSLLADWTLTDRGAAITVTSMATNATKSEMLITTGVSSGLTAGRVAQLRSANVSAWIAADAEL